MRTVTLCLVALLAAGAAAQSSPVLQIEDVADRAERDALETRLAQLRLTVKLRAEPPRELVRQLAAATGDLATFVVRPHAGGSDFVALDLDAERVTVLQCLALVQRISDLRFVYAHGAVIVTHKDDVKPPVYLRLYDVRAATHKLREFVAPRLDLVIGERAEEPREIETENTPCGLTLERLEELIRSHVRPDSWSGEASIVAANGVLIVRQTEAGHAEIRRLLAELGVAPPARVTVLPRRTARGTARASDSRPATRRRDGR